MFKKSYESSFLNSNNKSNRFVFSRSEITITVEQFSTWKGILIE